MSENEVRAMDEGQSWFVHVIKIMGAEYVVYVHHTALEAIALPDEDVSDTLQRNWVALQQLLKTKIAAGNLDFQNVHFRASDVGPAWERPTC